MPEIQIDDSNKIVIEKKEFKGRNYIDVRKQFLGDNGDWLSTKKGLTVTPEEWVEIFEQLLPLLPSAPQKGASVSKKSSQPSPDDDIPF